MGQFLPADHSKGDANTIGGYMAVHSRPAAFEGSDGASYSVEIVTDTSGEEKRPFAAYLLSFAGAKEIPSRADTSRAITSRSATARSKRAISWGRCRSTT